MVAIVPPTTVTAQTYMNRAKQAGLYIDASRGHKFRAILILDDGCVVSAAISIPTLLKRFSEDFDVDYTTREGVEEEMEDIIFEPQDGVE